MQLLIAAARRKAASSPWQCPCSAARLVHTASSAEQPPPREQLHYDACIVGAGPAGLAAAIRLKQVCCLHLYVCRQ